MARDRAEVLYELLTLAMSVPAAPTIMVVATVHHLPTWWLIVAGMFIGWASDAVGVLFGHCMGLYRAHRTALPPHPSYLTASDSEQRARPDTDPQHGHQPRPDPGRPQ